MLFDPEFRPGVIELVGPEMVEEILNRAVGTRVRSALNGDLLDASPLPLSGRPQCETDHEPAHERRLLSQVSCAESPPSPSPSGRRSTSSIQPLMLIDA